MSTPVAEPIWNTKVTVIDLIPAGSGQEALDKLIERLARCGFDVHVDGDDTQDAFESETLSDSTEKTVREEWSRPFHIGRFDVGPDGIQWR